MEVNLREGIDGLRFGMKQKDVEKQCGTPDKQYKDDEDNVVYLYNDRKIMLTFYEEEDYRLSYMASSHPELELFSSNIIDEEWEDVKKLLEKNGVKGFEKEDFDSFENYFNEDNWLTLAVEFGEVTRVEIGAIISDEDEFEWKFKE